MERMTPTKQTGCGQGIAITMIVLWLGTVPAGATVGLNALLGDTLSAGWLATLTIAVTALLLLPPFVVIALILRKRDGWHATAITASASAAIAGYILINGCVSALFPPAENPPLYGEGAGSAALRIGLLLPYLLLAAWLAPRLAGAPSRSLLDQLALTQLNWPTMLLGLAVAAVVTGPWSVTGALGDSLTSLSLAFQALAQVLPLLLLFWGVVYALLSAATDRPWRVASMVLLLYGLSLPGEMLPTGNPGVLLEAFALIPLGFLLTELRVRQGGIYPLIPVAFGYHSAPALFVDPRDIVAQGTPDPSHILSTTVVLITLIVLGPALWAGRRLLAALVPTIKTEIPSWLSPAAAALAATVTIITWIGLYIFGGSPGFYNDSFLIILEEQADLSDAYDISDREARLQYVYDTLTETAEETQAPLRAQLDDMGVLYRPYYIINMIRVDGPRRLMGHFEDQPGVAQVILNPNVRHYAHRVPLPYFEGGNTSRSVQSNLAAINADDAWHLGVMGEGIVVAGQDTGYDWTHPVLQPHYRGWDGAQAEHDYNWHDAWDDTAVPFDDDSHGTHTMGTVLGDDGGQNRTGVAPEAQWIGCRNMRRGFGNPAAYAECMEFFLAPYPHGGDPFVDGDVRYAPHVVNNSWGCPDIEGCFPETLEPAAEALRAGGIMMVVSAGNDGPSCLTVHTPPANYDAVFSVAATNELMTVTSFSSRGPTGDLIKPDIAAPGAQVRSSVPGGGYGYAGGTSMAGPHVAGAVALLWSADASLIGDIDATEALLCQAAVPRPVEGTCPLDGGEPANIFSSSSYNPICACGAVSGTPNNVYGCGFLDVGTAARVALEQ